MDKKELAKVTNAMKTEVYEVCKTPHLPKMGDDFSNAERLKAGLLWVV